jgi:hypothetical protein
MASTMEVVLVLRTKTIPNWFMALVLSKWVGIQVEKIIILIQILKKIQVLWLMYHPKHLILFLEGWLYHRWNIIAPTPPNLNGTKPTLIIVTIARVQDPMI